MANIASEQVGNFADAQRGDNHFQVGPCQDSERLSMETIAAIGDSEERATIYDAEQAYFSQPSRMASAQDFSSSSSMSAEL